MLDYLKPLFKKAPEKLILVIGTNDMNKKTPEEILKRLKELKSFKHANL